MKKSPLFLLIFSVLLMTCHLLLGSQQEKKTQELKHDVSVTLKLVQVYVTDTEGRPVKDLKKSDFVLFDNDVEQIVTDFEKRITSEKTHEVEEPQPRPPDESASEMNRKFFILIDLDSVTFKNIQRSKEMMLHFFDTQLQATDEISLFTVSSHGGLIIRQYLTTDHEKVRKIIAAFKDVGGERDWKGVSIADEPMGSNSITQYSIRRENRNVNSNRDAVEASIQRDAIRGRNHARLIKRRHFLDYMKLLSKSLQYIPGNKYVLFFSQGWSSVFASKAFFRRSFKDMAQEIATAGVPVYSIDTNPGIGSPGIKKKNVALDHLSQVTGGQYFQDIQEYDEISEQIQTLTGNYYVLGYYTSEAWDGKFHTIDVKVKRDACQITTQAGYYNPLPFPRLSQTEKLLQLMDLALAQEGYAHKVMDFPLISLPGEFIGKPHLTMIAEAPLDEMTEVIQNKVEVITLIFDKEETLLESVETKMNLSKVNSDTVYFYTVAPILPGDYECRFIIRNLETGSGAVASSSAFVPERTENGFQIFPPLMLKQQSGGVYMKGAVFKKLEKEMKRFSLADIFSIDTDQYTPYIEKTLPTNTDVWASILCAVPSGAASKVQLSAILFDKTMVEEIPIPLEIINASDKGGMKSFFVRLQIPEVETDEYSLIFTAKHTDSGATSQISCDFLIKEEGKTTVSLRAREKGMPQSREKR